MSVLTTVVEISSVPPLTRLFCRAVVVDLEEVCVNADGMGSGEVIRKDLAP